MDGPLERPAVGLTLIGAGGLGSWTALALAKCGFHPLTIYDHDVVEEKNTRNQVYGRSAVGGAKPGSLANCIHRQVPNFPDITACNKRVTPSTVLQTRIVVTAVDSIEARRDIFKAIEASPQVTLLVDLRAGGGTVKVLVCYPRDADSVRWYTATHLVDAPALPLCLQDFEAHVGMLAASLTVRTLDQALVKGGTERLVMVYLPRLHTVIDEVYPWNT